VALVLALACSVRPALPEDPRASGDSTRALADIPGEQSSPRYSADGHSVVFVGTTPQGDRGFFVMNADGSAPRRIGDAATSGSGPAWAPDGKGFAFMRGGSVWIIGLGDSSARRLTQPRRNASGADWSPDGREILFAGSDTAGAAADVWAVSLDGRLRRITEHPDAEWFPRWFPERGQVAFYSTWGREMTDIWVASERGRAPLRVTDDPAEDFSPAVSPDGRWIAFVSLRGGRSDLWLAPSSGGPATRITNDDARESAPDWSPDGSNLIFQWDTSHAQIWSVRPDGGQRVQLTRGTRDHDRPVVSRTGQLAFESNEESGEPNIVVADKNSRTARRLLPANASQREPAWSADGEAVAFVNNPTGFYPGRDLWIGTLDGAPARRLTTIGDVHYPVWVGKDSAIAFVARGKLQVVAVRSGEVRVLRADPDLVLTDYMARTGELIGYASGAPLAIGLAPPYTTRALPQFLERSSGMRLSKDGLRVAYISSRDGSSDLYVAGIDGRGNVRLTDDADAESWPSWGTDDRRIVFSRRRAASRIGIRSVPIRRKGAGR
jgi:TolB protein